MKQLLFAFFLLNFCAAGIAAQGNPEQAAKNARDQFSDIKNRSIELERIKRSTNQKTDKEDLPDKFPEIKEDFEKIQKINSKIQMVDAKSAPNYAQISKSAIEINHRALRLRSNLFSVDSKQDESLKDRKLASNYPESIERLLKSLDQAINKFVHNSVFLNTKVVSSSDSLKAQNDLDTLIKISSQIKLKLKTVKSVKDKAEN